VLYIVIGAVLLDRQCRRRCVYTRVHQSECCIALQDYNAASVFTGLQELFSSILVSWDLHCICGLINWKAVRQFITVLVFIQVVFLTLAYRKEISLPALSTRQCRQSCWVFFQDFPSCFDGPLHCWQGLLWSHNDCHILITQHRSLFLKTWFQSLSLGPCEALDWQHRPHWRACQKYSQASP
jgi:hypothetical protein